MDLTATPRKNSNILSYVDARELKNENEAEQIELGENPPIAKTDLFDDIDTEEVKKALENSADQSDSPLNDMLQDAQRQAESYDTEMKSSGNSSFWGGELGDMLNQKPMQPQFVEEAYALRIPQFFLKYTPDLFGGEYELLEKENLSEGFPSVDRTHKSA